MCIILLESHVISCKLQMNYITWCELKYNTGYKCSNSAHLKKSYKNTFLVTSYMM